MEGFVERIYAKPSVPSVIAVTEVGSLNSTEFLTCGMALEDTSKRPVLKIFNHHGGTVEEEDTTRKETGKKYLVLRNKKTNKVLVYGTKVMYLKKPDYFKMKTFEDESLTDKNHEFNKVFGTRKSSRMSKSRLNDTVDSSTEVFNIIHSSSSDVLDQSFSKLNEFAIYLPVGCNRFSNKLDTVYPVSTLLREHEIHLMTDYAKEVISMVSIIKSGSEDFTNFFTASIRKISLKSIQNICLLTLADGLLELLKSKSQDLNSEDVILYPNCQLINDKVLDNFLEYSITGRDLSSRMKDKIVCHLIIIMFLINMNTFDLCLITPFLPMSSQKRLILLMKVVGATPVKDDKTKYTLKLPLSSLPSFQKTPKRTR